MEVGERSWLIELDVASAFHATCRSSGDDDGELLVIVDIWISHAAPVEEKRVIEEASGAVIGGFHFLEEFGEEGDVEGVDFRHALDLGRIISVVRKRMVWIGDAGLGVNAVTRFASKLEGGDAGDVSLEGEHLKLEHQARVILIGSGNAFRAVGIGKCSIAGGGFGLLNTGFDFAHGCEVVVDAALIGFSKVALEAVEVITDEVEEARFLREGATTLRSISTFAKEAFENEARVRFCRKWGGG